MSGRVITIRAFKPSALDLLEITWHAATKALQRFFKSFLLLWLLLVILGLLGRLRPIIVLADFVCFCLSLVLIAAVLVAAFIAAVIGSRRSVLSGGYTFTDDGVEFRGDLGTYRATWDALRRFRQTRRLLLFSTVDGTHPIFIPKRCIPSGELDALVALFSRSA